LRRTLYTHVQRLSLAFHDQQPTGDLISRVTVDIDSVQSFIVSGLLSILVDTLTLVGMIVVMFCVNWQFTLIALSVVPPLFIIVNSYTRKVKKASREVRKKEGRMISVVSEVVSSIRVVKAFSREDYEVRRFEGESLEVPQGASRPNRQHRHRDRHLRGSLVWCAAGHVRPPRARLFGRFCLLPRQDVQAYARHFEDHRFLFESRHRIRSHTGNSPKRG
jgi:ABC-type multidrug transport system fused ATPase/permease subunit